MASDLIRTQLGSTLAVKSLADLVRVKTPSEHFLLIDVSGSMGDHMRNGKTRISGLTDVVNDLRKEGKIRLIAFGGEGAYLTDMVPRASGGTPLHQAIDLARTTGAGRAIVISDGQPNDGQAAMDAARAFGGQLDVVFVGDPGEGGESFLRELAQLTGGTEFHGDLSKPKELGAKIAGLLGAMEGDEE